MADIEKIHIMGGPGSGKSFIADVYAEANDCMHLDLDTIFWDGDFTQKTEPKIREQRLMEIVEKPEWVIEGAYCKDWVLPSIEASDVVVALEISPALQLARLMRRNIRRLAQGETTVREAKGLIDWSRGYNQQMEEFLKKLHRPYGDKIVRLSGRKATERFFETLS